METDFPIVSRFCLKKPETFRVPWFRILLSLGMASGLHAAEKVYDHWNLFSSAQDVQLGQELSDWLEARIQLSQEPSTARFIDKLGNRLLSSNPGTEITFTFKLVADQGLYSFAYPGGPVFFTSGLLAAMDTENLFAGLVTHQLAHISLRHTTRAISRAERFRVRAAMVVADDTHAPLLETLEKVEIYLSPGAPLSGFDADAESEANGLASQWLFNAGYDPGAAQQALDSLRSQFPEQAGQFLRQHPQIPEVAVAAGKDEFTGHKLSKSLLSKRSFRKLRSTASEIPSGNEALQALVAWSPPEPVATPARSREVFITRSYSFAYPNSWQAGKRGFDERIQVAPKGGIANPAGGQPRLLVGIIAGTLELSDTSQTATEALLANIDQIRPGLQAAVDQAGIEPMAHGLENMMLQSRAASESQPELIWAVAKRLPESFFYLLMIAPQSEFAGYRHEFEAIFKSIEFLGHPQPSRMEAHGREG